MNATDVAVDKLCEALTQACREAMEEQGFPPSERLIDKIHEEIRYAITLR